MAGDVCVVEGMLGRGHAFQWDVHGRGMCVAGGVCVAEGRGHA